MLPVVWEASASWNREMLAFQEAFPPASLIPDVYKQCWVIMDYGPIRELGVVIKPIREQGTTEHTVTMY